MNNMNFNKFTPIVTGTPTVHVKPKQSTAQPNADFMKILLDSCEVNFSKHAVNRVLERGVDVSEGSLERLDDGIKLAEDKGLSEPLILIDSTAFIVNIRNNTVITAVTNEDLRGNVFTNIDGTVII
ncbi:MAG: flagellar protein [Oscillospiraceae bacterium]|jgi:flagellar operon protein|nr:flagellar protein [Oscillospiraceae bacterium]